MATGELTTYPLDTRGPYDLGAVALMGFGHRDERSFDQVMRVACCLDGDCERQVGVEVRQHHDRLTLTVHPDAAGDPVSGAALDRLGQQVARVLSVDHDGAAFTALCGNDPALAPVAASAPGFRPALFYSPYEAAVWSIISARRSRPQSVRLRQRLSAELGATFNLAGQPTVALPTPSALLGLERFPGLPADRIPRLHAVAAAAQAGLLSARRFVEMGPDAALAELQRLPGIGPFYSALIVIRACGFADVLSTAEPMSRQAVERLYGLDHAVSDAEFTELAQSWRPFRTWVLVLIRAKGPGASGPTMSPL